MASGSRPTGAFDFHDAPMHATDIPPKFDEIIAAGVELSPTSGAVDWLTRKTYPEDPTFKPDPHTLDRRFFGIAEELFEAGSEEEFRAIQLREMKRQDAMTTAYEEGGVAGVIAAVGLDFFDPSMLPFMAVPFIGAGSRALNVAKFGGVVAADVGIREGIAHYQQPSRTQEDTIPIMLAATGLGMAMGALLRPSLSKVPKKTADKMVQEHEKIYREASEGKSVGAAAVSAYNYHGLRSVADEMVIAPKIAAKMVVPNPRSRLAHSANDAGMAEPSSIGDELVRGHVPKARDTKGRPPLYPAGKTMPWDEEVMGIQNYLADYAAGTNRAVRNMIKQKLGKKPSHRAVDELLARRYRYGDEVPLPDSLRQKIPDVDHILDDLDPFIKDYEELLGSFSRRQEAVGMFGYATERVKDAAGKFVRKKNGEFKTTYKRDAQGRKIKLKASDLPRYSFRHMHTIFDRKWIAKNPNRFAAMVAHGYRNPKRLQQLGVTEERDIEALFERGLDAVQNISNSVKTNIGDGGRVAVHYGPPSTKPITMKVLREDIDGGIIHSMDAELSYYAKEVEPILNGLERYGDSGLVYHPNKGVVVPALMERMTDEVKLLRGPLSESDPVGLSKLMKKYEQYMADVQHIVNKITGADRFLGTMDVRFGRALNELRAATAFAWLGNVGLASVHEVARVQMFHGLGPMAKTMGLMINPTDLSKANIDMLRAYHMGLDMTAARSSAMLRADIEDPVALSGLGSWMSRHADKVYQWTGTNYMLGKFKEVEALTFMSDAVAFATKRGIPEEGSGAYKAAMRNFTRFGLGKREFKQIAKEVEDGGFVQHNGVWLVDVDKFKNGSLLDKFMSVSASAGETSIVHGGKGAIPIILDNPIGRSMAQFKRVFFGYQGRMENLALSLKEGDLRVAGGLMTSFAMTWMAWQLRTFLKYLGDDPTTAAEEFMKQWEASPIQDHIYQMMERTGYAGLVLQGVRISDKATRGGLSHAIKTNVGSKFHRGDGTVMASMFPSLTWSEKVMSVITSPLTEEGVTPKTLKNAASLGPLATVIYIDPILAALANAAGTTIDEPSKKAKGVKF